MARGDYTRYARGLHKIRTQITQDTHADLPPIKYLNPRRGFGGIPRGGGSGVSPEKGVRGYPPIN